MMTKAEVAFLKRLAKHMIGIRMRGEYPDVPVDSDTYQAALSNKEKRCSRIAEIRRRGLITESEAVQLITKTA